MSNEIKPFEFEGNKIRTLADGDTVIFVASTSPRFSATATQRTSPEISMMTRRVRMK